jgi:hypothetical protein
VQLHLQLDQELVDDAQDVVEIQPLNWIDASSRLRNSGVNAADRLHRVGAVVLLDEADGAPRRLLGAGIGRHHQHHVA